MQTWYNGLTDRILLLKLTGIFFRVCLFLSVVQKNRTLVKLLIGIYDTLVLAVDSVTELHGKLDVFEEIELYLRIIE